MLVSGKPFQHTEMFVGEARSLPLSESPDRLERFAGDQHSNLLQKSINYDCKGFKVQAPVYPEKYEHRH